MYCTYFYYLLFYSFVWTTAKSHKFVKVTLNKTKVFFTKKISDCDCELSD